MDTPKLFKVHGSPARGLESTPLSESFEGRFGRMFHSLSLNHPAVFGHSEVENRQNLRALAVKMISPAEVDDHGQPDPTPEADEHDTAGNVTRTATDDEENFGIDAGYTYLGQFIDHDLTFDPNSSLIKKNDPNSTIDFRSPRFDLDNLYGRGPDDQPYLYEDDQIKLLLGRKLSGNPHDSQSRDLPRNNPHPLAPNEPTVNRPARALVGDPRNDENVIVSQLQVAMIRFHNRMVDVMRTDAETHGTPVPTFDQVQQEVRYHYQWIILHDFLPTIIRQDVLSAVLPEPKLNHIPTHDEYKARLKYYKWEKEPYIPVEFAVAAYRFGHSMVRPIYRLNTDLPVRQFIFDNADEFLSLRGFREFPESWAVDWRLFFDFNDPTQPKDNNGKDRVQKSYKIDTSLVNPLGMLPSQVVTQMPGIPSLAERNLLRSWQMRLPSGQAIAKFMGLKPLCDEELLIGKGTVEFQTNTVTPPTDPKDKDKRNVPLASLSPVFKGNAPLWFYVLAEARNSSFTGHDEAHFQLGPVGGRIVAEVFIGLLVGDVHSYIYQNPGWTPRPDFMTGGFKMVDLLKQSLKA